MQVRTRHNPSFGVVRVMLSSGEAVHAPAGARTASSFGVAEQQDAGARGAGRGQRTVFTAPDGGGWLDLAPAAPAHVYPLELDGNSGWSLARDTVFACPSSVGRDRSWPPLRALFGSDQGFLEHYSGTGPLVLAAHGPVDAFTLDAGEIITVTPAFLVGYPDGLQCRLRALTQSGAQSVRTGEGLAVDLAGPGTVLVQARAAAR